MYFASNTTCAAAPTSLLVAHSGFGAVDGDSLVPVDRPRTLADLASAEDFLAVLRAARTRYDNPDEIDDEIRETHREIARIRAAFRAACL